MFLVSGEGQFDEVSALGRAEFEVEREVDTEGFDFADRVWMVFEGGLDTAAVSGQRVVGAKPPLPERAVAARA